MITDLPHARRGWMATLASHHEAMRARSRPYPGVMEVVRWFQLQPDTYVGVNTGRPESWRADTMRCLNRLAAEYRVSFADELVCLNRGGSVFSGKASALAHFRSLGYRVFAFVDNEPANLAAVEEADTCRGWGINRFALAWDTPNLRATCARLEAWGCDLDLCDVPDLAAFLSAVLLLPRSITSGFNFPQRQYHGSREPRPGPSARPL